MLSNAHILKTWIDRVYEDNPNSVSLWGRPSDLRPHGFIEAEANISQDVLKGLYQDDFIVKEKKGFVLDLERSQGSYMISIEPENSRAIKIANL